MDRRAGSRHSRWAGGVAAGLVVALGVLSNLATSPAIECDDGVPYTVVIAGDGQVGAATAPLGTRIAAQVSCRDKASGRPIEAGGQEVTWSVTGGGGRVDGASTLVKRVDPGGRTAVAWTLGPDIGEQTAELTVRGQRFGFRATAGGPASGGTCAGGAGTTLEPMRDVEGDERWTLAGSPYRGVGVTVVRGATLTIDAGVTTCLQQLTAYDRGRIVVEGSADAPVRMQPAAVTNQWLLELRHFGLDGPLAPSVLRHVQAERLQALRVWEHPLAIEDSRFVATGAGTCGQVYWAVGGGPLAGSGVWRSVFDGYARTVAGCTDPALVFEFSARPADGGALPFEARVLNAGHDAVVLRGNQAPAVAFANCEIAGSAANGLVIGALGVGAPQVTVAGCNFSGNVGFALRNDRASGAGIVARGNWWGDPAGPPTTGPNAVSPSVDTAEPAAAPFALGY